MLVEMVSSHPDEILATLDAVPSDLPRQALAFARLITALPVRAASETQQRVFDEAARGLTGSEARETYVNTVIASYKRGLCHMDESGPAVKRLLEHYTLNEMFAGAFPFVRGSPTTEYRHLVGRFGTLRFLLAARFANEPALDAVALSATAYVFARRFNHSARFASAVGSLLTDNGCSSARSIGALLRT